jgi:hypothetical protein
VFEISNGNGEIGETTSHENFDKTTNIGIQMDRIVTKVHLTRLSIQVVI